MFYKLIFTLFIFSSFCFSSNDIQNLKSFQSKFTQTITSSSSDIITYQGEVFIKSSGQILWKYKTPIVKNVYIENNMAIVDEPELEQLDKLAERYNTTIASVEMDGLFASQIKTEANISVY